LIRLEKSGKVKKIINIKVLGGTMSARRIVYLIALVIVGIVVYYSGSYNQYPVTESYITKESILNNFKNFSGYQNDAKTLTGNYKTTDIFFPADYSGSQGDEFYVTIQDGQTVITLKYVIKERSDKPHQLEYQLKDTWENFKPPQGKFETYHLQDNRWMERK
jgi:hypothetical protein